jgi:hypothetical protein
MTIDQDNLLFNLQPSFLAEPSNVAYLIGSSLSSEYKFHRKCSLCPT